MTLPSLSDPSETEGGDTLHGLQEGNEHRMRPTARTIRDKRKQIVNTIKWSRSLEDDLVECGLLPDHQEVSWHVYPSSMSGLCTNLVYYLKVCFLINKASDRLPDLDLVHLNIFFVTHVIFILLIYFNGGTCMLHGTSCMLQNNE